LMNLIVTHCCNVIEWIPKPFELLLVTTLNQRIKLGDGKVERTQLAIK
jgi:hypothetical protein